GHCAIVVTGACGGGVGILTRRVLATGVVASIAADVVTVIASARRGGTRILTGGIHTIVASIITGVVAGSRAHCGVLVGQITALESLQLQRAPRHGNVLHVFRREEVGGVEDHVGDVALLVEQ